ncbi:MAG: lamin tail domain-containing protein [Candidatus Izemoplasmatales bacterium]
MKKLAIIISTFLLAAVYIGQFGVRVEAASPIGNTYVVDVTSHFGAGNTVDMDTSALAYGSKISIDPTSGSYPDYSFAFWIVNGVVRKDLAVNYQFTVTDSMTLHAIFKPTGSYAVVFMDSNGKLIGEVQYVESGADATPPSTDTYTKIGYTFADTKWSGTYTSVTEDKAIILQYVLSNANTFSVTFSNVANVARNKDLYAFNEVAQLTADETDGTNPFSHWAIGTHIISYDRVFYTTMLDNIYPTAVYLATPLTPAAVISISDALSLRDGYVSFKGQFDLPSGYSLIEYGILTSSDYQSSINIDTASNKYRSEKYNGQTGEFMMSFQTANVKTARGYLIYNDGDSIEIAYSDISLANGETVIIAEVYGGGGNTGAIYKNDFIMLYNTTAKPISLAGYSVQYASATGTSWTNKTNLTGTIKPYCYFLIQEAAGTGGTTDLPTPEVVGTIAMGGSSGKVALVSNTTVLTGANPSSAAGVVDFVGYGTTANGYEGTGPTPAPSNTSSVARKNYFFDTDQNATDFLAGTPTPRNSTYVPW